MNQIHISGKTYSRLDSMIENKKPVKIILKWCKNNNIPVNFTDITITSLHTYSYNSLIRRSLLDFALIHNHSKLIHYLHANRIVGVNDWYSLTDYKCSPDSRFLKFRPDEESIYQYPLIKFIDILIKHYRLDKNVKNAWLHYWHNKDHKDMPLFSLL